MRVEKSSYSIEDGSDMTMLLVMSNTGLSGLFALSVHAQEPGNLTTQGTSLADKEPRCQFIDFAFPVVASESGWPLTVFYCRVFQAAMWLVYKRISFPFGANRCKNISKNEDFI